MVIDTYHEETTVIGAICRDEKMIRVVARYVEPKHFFLGSCRTIYEYALDADGRGKTFDVLVCANDLAEKVPHIREFLAECMEIVPTTANTEMYAKLLREKADERELREKVGMALSDENGEKLTESIAAICSELIANRAGGRMKRYRDVMEKTYKGLFTKAENRCDTGYGKLDAMLKGMWGGELIILAARPAVGKSAFALSIAEHVAQREKTVQLYSLEMEDTEVGERSLARHTKRMTMNEIIDRNLGDDTYDPRTLDEMSEDATKAYLEVADLPIFVDDSPNVKPSKVRAQALTQKDLGLIIVDYGGLMAADRKYDSRNLELGAISRALKNLAKELKVPVLMLGQLNRGVGDEQKPTLRELRDSGELEQNANKCIFLWNIDKEHGLVGVSVAKNRKGRTGELVMQFDGGHMRFTETEEQYEGPTRKRKQRVYEDDE